MLVKREVKLTETLKLLREIIEEPKQFLDDAKLITALKSQSSLAQLQILERNIVSCSLNTLKSSSEYFLERGFVQLDELRISAKNAIQATSAKDSEDSPNRYTVAGLKAITKDLENQLDISRKSNFLLNVIISELRSQLKQIAEHDGTVEERTELYRYYNKKVEAELHHTLSELNNASSHS